MQVNSISANTGLRLKAPRFLSIPFKFSTGGGKITIPTGPQSIGNSIQPQYVFIDNSANQGIIILQAGGLNYIIAPMATAGFPVVMGDTSEIKLLSNISAVGTVILTDTAIAPFDNNPNVNGVTITSALPSGSNLIGQVGITGDVNVNVNVNSAPLSDFSGTITTASESQEIVTVSSGTEFLLIQNLSTDDMYFNFGTAATLGDGSILVGPGQLVIFDRFVPSGVLNVISATAGSQYTVKAP